MKWSKEEQNNIQGMIMGFMHKYSQVCFQQLNDIEVHPGQIPILKVIGLNQGLSQKQLAKLLNIKPPTVAVAVKRLEKIGYVCRKQDEEDQRISHIYLTESGEAITEKITEIVKENEKILAQGFSEDELETLRGYLRRITDNLDRKEKEGEREEA